MNRIFVEKKPEFHAEARQLLAELRESLGLRQLQAVRVVQRYDADGLDPAAFDDACRLILAEPQVDTVSTSLPLEAGDHAFAVEYLPGQFDQRADSAAQCVQILTAGEKPLFHAAKVFVLAGDLTDSDLARVKQFVINSVDSREASLAVPESLSHPAADPPDVAALAGFTSLCGDDLAALRSSLGLAMSQADIEFCQAHYRDEERRDPTLTEIRMLDTYWSDHCRHTTFLASIEEVTFDETGTEPVKQAWQTYLATREQVFGTRSGRPVTMMDIALLGMRELRKSGELDNLEVSDEVNAASIVVPVEISAPGSGNPDPIREDWLVMFKNETHNHPTEIEPFGGAATCLGGAIRDPLSGRSYVYQAMRVTGAADPRAPFAETLPGKLPQRKICQQAAHGYSSYGNQIGLATGQVAEIYHPGYVAKRMEIGAVVAAAPRANVFRGTPAPGDVILLIGGRTGRDGIGGATGSSKEHTDTALENSAEVQKGDAPTERKLQRLFRNPELARKIKVCNDFGAGGVSVAIGEIAPSLDIDLDAVPKKYAGLDGTELAISESQERMAVCIDPADVPFFLRESDRENLECTRVAAVADNGRLRMTWRGQRIVDLSRAFLDSNGAPQGTCVRVNAPAGACPLDQPLPSTAAATEIAAKLRAVLSDLNHCSQKGLGERFDASIGTATVLHPFGGEHQLTPPDAMAAKLPVSDGTTDACTFMAWGHDPFLASWSPFHGAVYAVTQSVCKAVAAGARLDAIRLTLQEYFPKPGTDPRRWGLPFAALLGAFHAQHGLRLAAIGGKDSMSGSFNDLDVPPTLVSFAVAPGLASLALTPEFKQAGSVLSLVTIPRDGDQLPDFARLKEVAALLHEANAAGRILSLKALGTGGLAHALATSAFGNRIGAEIPADLDLFTERQACFLVESGAALPAALAATRVGTTIPDPLLRIGGTTLLLDDLLAAWTSPLEDVYPTRCVSPHPEIETFTAAFPRAKPQAKAAVPAGSGHGSRPRVIIPVFPGTNCEYDSARAFREAGAEPEVLVFRNLTANAIRESLDSLAAAIGRSQILMLPGGFSAGDEPDGSGKFIATVLRNPRVADAVMKLIKDRDGLVLGICNGFQALVKTGLVPYGEIRDPRPDSPTLTFNDIGRHVSCYVTTRVASTLSPWLSLCETGELHRIPVSHGEGKFHAPVATIRELAGRGQVAFQYCDANGVPTMEITANPNGSMFAIEGITSPCGRVLGKMAHSERRGPDIAKNIPGPKYQPLFDAGVQYFAAS